METHQNPKTDILEKGEALFWGNYEHTIDAKGRLSIPSKYRDIMSAGNEDTFFVTMSFFDTCIVAYPLYEWKEMVSVRMKTLPVNDEGLKILLRHANLKGAECQIDGQGRILIPGNLRQEAGLERDIVLVGMTNRIEIWDKSKVANSVQADKEILKGVNQHLALFGL